MCSPFVPYLHHHRLAAFLLLLSAFLFAPGAGFATPPIPTNSADTRAESVDVSDGADTAGVAKQGQGYAAGINFGTGNKLTTIPIVSWTARGGMPVSFALFHNSHGDEMEPFAPKWRYSYESYLALDSGGSATIHWDNGSAVTFTENGGTFTAPVGEHGTFHENTTRDIHGNVSYFYVSPSQITYVFNQGYGLYLTAISDRNGNGITISRSGTSPYNISAITDPSGRTLNLQWSGNQLTEISDPNSRSWTFTYGLSGT